MPRLKAPNILGKCMSPFLSTAKCTNCKQFDICYSMMEKANEGAKHIPKVKDDLLNREAWKHVDFHSYNGRRLLLKMQSAKG